MNISRFQWSLARCLFFSRLCNVYFQSYLKLCIGFDEEIALAKPLVNAALSHISDNETGKIIIDLKILDI